MECINKIKTKQIHRFLHKKTKSYLFRQFFIFIFFCQTVVGNENLLKIGCMKKGQILNILLNMPKLKKIPDQCHSYEEIRNESKDESSNVGRSLRKRKVNLNRLASSVSCPEVCQFQHCGVQLANDDTLEVSLCYS